MSILKLLAVCLIAATMSVAARAQMPPPGPSGLELEIAGEIDVYQMPMTWEDGQTFNLAGRFYYARYVDGALPLGSLERAKSALYGVYFSAGGESRWVIKPEWSGLFPVNSDYAIVRKPGKDEWLSLQIDKGKTSKIGKGEVRIMDVLHPESMARESEEPLYRYYLSTNDNGDTQAVTLLNWNAKKKRVEALKSFPNALSPANQEGLVPLQLTYGRDVIVRRRLPDGAIDERVVNQSAIRFGSAKFDVLLYNPSGTGPFVFTAPSRLLLRVLDSEKQLYFPYQSQGEAAEVLNANAPEFSGFLGARPVGDRVTTELSANPLYHQDEAGLVALWETDDGVRLAPLLEMPPEACFMSIYDRSLCSVRQGKLNYLDYPSEGTIKQSREYAVYVAIEHIELPENVRHTNGDTSIKAALRCYLPDGRVDIWASMPYISNMRRPPVKLNATPLPDADAADAFMRSIATPDGLIALRKAEYDKMMGDLAERFRIAEEERRAALTPAERAAEDTHREWTRKHAERAAKIAERVETQLTLGDYGAAMDIALEDWGEVPKVVALALEAGRADVVDDDVLRHAYNTREYNEWGAKNSVAQAFFSRFPPAVRASSGYQYQSSASTGGRTYDNPAPLYTMPDYRMESKMNYLSGLSSSYMCGSSSFCN